MAPSGELRGKGKCGVFAGKTVRSTPERLSGEVFTIIRYTNLRLPLPLLGQNVKGQGHKVQKTLNAIEWPARVVPAIECLLSGLLLR